MDPVAKGEVVAVVAVAVVVPAEANGDGTLVAEAKGDAVDGPAPNGDAVVVFPDRERPQNTEYCMILTKRKGLLGLDTLRTPVANGEADVETAPNGDASATVSQSLTNRERERGNQKRTLYVSSNHA